MSRRRTYNGGLPSKKEFGYYVYIKEIDGTYLRFYYSTDGMKFNEGARLIRPGYPSIGHSSKYYGAYSSSTKHDPIPLFIGSDYLYILTSEFRYKSDEDSYYSLDEFNRINITQNLSSLVKSSSTLRLECVYDLYSKNTSSSSNKLVLTYGIDEDNGILYISTLNKSYYPDFILKVTLDDQVTYIPSGNFSASYYGYYDNLNGNYNGYALQGWSSHFTSGATLKVFDLKDEDLSSFTMTTNLSGSSHSLSVADCKVDGFVTQSCIYNSYSIQGCANPNLKSGGELIFSSLSSSSSSLFYFVNGSNYYVNGYKSNSKYSINKIDKDLTVLEGVGSITTYYNGYRLIKDILYGLLYSSYSENWSIMAITDNIESEIGSSYLAYSISSSRNGSLSLISMTYI